MAPVAQAGWHSVPRQVAAGQLLVPSSVRALSWAQLWHQWCPWLCPLALTLMLKGPQGPACEEGWVAQEGLSVLQIAASTWVPVEGIWV